MDRVRACVIGAGLKANEVHYPSLASFDDVELAAACDLDAARLQATATRWEIPQTFDDYRAMVDAVQPDAVYAIGQPHQMYDVWLWCLDQGVNLYVEKPLGLTLHQAQMLTYLAEEKGVVTQVSHQRRTHPLFRFGRERCLARGPIAHAVAEIYKWDPRPRLEPRDHMLDNAVHAIDTLRWLFDSEVVEIESRCRRIGTPDINWIGATLYFASGSVGYVIFSCVSGRLLHRIEMHAPGIAVDANVESAWIHTDSERQGTFYDAREFAGSNELYVYGGFQAKHREFVDAVRDRAKSTGSPFRDSMKTMEVAEAMLGQAVLRERSVTG